MPSPSSDPIPSPLWFSSFLRWSTNWWVHQNILLTFSKKLKKNYPAVYTISCTVNENDSYLIFWNLNDESNTCNIVSCFSLKQEGL
jgi:hypothetical protein